MSNHAIFSPSSAYRWSVCTKYLTLPEKESTTNEYALKGTALHTYAERLLQKLPIELSYSGYAATPVDMRDIVAPYVEYVQAIKADIRLFEQKVFLSEDCYGTIDALLFNSDLGELHIVDLKTGHGFVSAQENSQLLIYAIGAVNLMREKKLKVKNIFVHIVQPTRENFSKEFVKFSDLAEFRKKILSVISLIKNEPEKTVFTANEKTCKWCPNITNCPAVKALAQKTAESDFKSISKKDDLVEAYRNTKVLKEFINAIEEKVFKVLELGEELPGLTLKEGHYRRTWVDYKEKDIIKSLSLVMRKKDFVTTSILSVAQLEKKIKGAPFEKKILEKVSGFIEKKQNKPSIVFKDIED